MCGGRQLFAWVICNACCAAAFIRAVDAYRAKMQQLQQQARAFERIVKFLQLPERAVEACQLSLLVFRTFIKVDGRLGGE